MIGVAGADPQEQLAVARAVVTPAIRERLARNDIHAAACARNGEAGFGPNEADFLFACVQSWKPAQIVQIGCGVSTAVCLMAAEEIGHKPKVICIDPYPTTFLKNAAQNKEITLVAKPVEELDYSFFSTMRAGDIFFVDSTHTLGPAGEVTRIILEMLPRLPAGVRVHFHDIWFPFDYSGQLLDGELFFWHESALLHAYLAFNPRGRILVSLSLLHYFCREELRELLPNYRPRLDPEGLTVKPGHHPCSIYLEVAD